MKTGCGVWYSLQVEVSGNKTQYIHQHVKKNILFWEPVSLEPFYGMESNKVTLMNLGKTDQ